MRASNIAWETPEGRSFFKLRPLQILVTLAMVIMLALVALALVLTGPDRRGRRATRSASATPRCTVWDIAKWPVLLGVVILMFSVLYYAAPNVKLPGFRVDHPGERVRGRRLDAGLGAVRASTSPTSAPTTRPTARSAGSSRLLVWMWITNLALLFGVELNAERERSRELDADVPRAEREIQLEPRDEPNDKRTT